MMLEECGLPYVLMPVNIGKGEQFEPGFLKISPNNRMPAIVDPDGPGGKPISVFESGAILQYLGRKTGKFYPTDERKRVAVDEWLFWQMAGLGPMAGQANHFLQLCQGRQRLRPQALHQRGASPARRDEQAARRTANISPALIPSPTWRAGAGWSARRAWSKWRIEISAREGLARHDRRAARRRRRASHWAANCARRRSDPKAQEEARKILFGQRART